MSSRILNCTLLLAWSALALQARTAESVDNGCECVDRKSGPDGVGFWRDMDICPGSQIKEFSHQQDTENCCEKCRKEGGPDVEYWVWGPNEDDSANCWCKGGPKCDSDQKVPSPPEQRRILGKVVKKEDCPDDWGKWFILAVVGASLCYCAVGFVRFYRIHGRAGMQGGEFIEQTTGLVKDGVGFTKSGFRNRRQGYAEIGGDQVNVTSIAEGEEEEEEEIIE